jgi:hypothetical protein
MLGLLAVPLGLIVGGALVYGLGGTTSADARAYQQHMAARKKDDDAPEGYEDRAKLAVQEARSGGKSLRVFLDVCFLAFIVVAALSIVMYERKSATGGRFDPLLSLARAFPREASILSDVFRRIREDWPAGWFVR